MELIQKINDAVADMKSKVDFNATDHTYIRLDNGQWLQGVSSVSSIVPKEWLPAWGAKECAKFLGYSDYKGDTEAAQEMMAKIAKCKTPEQYITILKDAKGAHARKSKTALVDGKAGHAWLEEFVKAKIAGEPLPEIPPGALKRPLTQFLEWEARQNLLWLLSEAMVANLEKGYAGTMDALAIVGGKLTVIDFKFASHISEDYYLQCSGYGACFDQYGIPVEQRIIIRLPKTLEVEQWNEKEKKYEMVPNNIEVEIVGTNYEGDKEAFFHALPVKQWVNQFIKSKK